MDSPAEKFLRERLAKETEQGYASVLRGVAPKGKHVSGKTMDWEETPSSVLREMAKPDVREEIPTAPKTPPWEPAFQSANVVSAMSAASLPWWQFLGRPWSGTWRWMLGIGIVVCVALGLTTVVFPGLHGLYAAAMAACVPVAMVTLFCELEVSRRVDTGVAVMICLVGGILSIGLTFLLSELTGIDSPFLAGVTEEPAKGAVLLGLAFVPRFRGILCGLLLGVCVGAGFAVIETMMYAYGFGEGGLPSTEVLFLRGVFSPFMHMSWTGALGGAIWMARTRPAQTWAAVLMLGGMIAAHCLWNTLGPFTYCALGLWALIFHYVKSGAVEAAQWGFSPKGV